LNFDFKNRHNMIHLISALLTGYLAYLIVAPQSFLGILGFLIVWGILEQLLALLIGFLVVFFSDKS